MEEKSLLNENNLEIFEGDIKKLIYTIRGKQVILDSDVAMLYHYETKRINQTVKRNIERFPEDFCFQLNESEVNNNWSQFVTSSNKDNNKHRGKKYLPYAFTEQGIAMLSGLLRSEIAVQVSINIMNAFVEMRKFINSNGQLFYEMNNIKYTLIEHDKKFDIIFNELQKNEKEEFNGKIFYAGQIYDAYSLIIKIIKKAEKKITIIDNYIDQSILEMLTQKNKNVKVVILTSNNCKITKLDIEKFNKQYPTLKVAKTNSFHDRFIVMDNSQIYHCGASLKDAGKKCFAINKMGDNFFLEKVN